MKTKLILAAFAAFAFSSCAVPTSGGVNWEQYNKSKRLNAENAFNAASFRTGGRSYLNF